MMLEEGKQCYEERVQDERAAERSRLLKSHESKAPAAPQTVDASTCTTAPDLDDDVVRKLEGKIMESEEEKRRLLSIFDRLEGGIIKLEGRISQQAEHIQRQEEDKTASAARISQLEAEVAAAAEKAKRDRALARQAQVFLGWDARPFQYLLGGAVCGRGAH
ncbi:hypothetical protein BDZ97DRAFT_599130 [Flammula alnicola]|nr:hypothetical protein BDZ97DRAFT_599130 [Flammula alnicola]